MTAIENDQPIHYLYVIGINQGTMSSFGRSYNGTFTMKEWADKRLANSPYDHVVEIVSEEIYVFLDNDNDLNTSIGEVCWLMDKVALTQEQIDEIHRIEIEAAEHIANHELANAKVL